MRSGALGYILIGLMLGSTPAAAPTETVERIAAVVGDRIILTSEVAGQVQMYLMSTGQEEASDFEKIYRDILEQMVNDELILSAAEGDTSITVSEAEIQSELDQHIASLAARFPSEEAFIQELRQEGLTKRTLEKRYYPQIRDQLLKQKIINQKLSKVSVSRQEVDNFYRDNADSLPDLPGQLKIAHILIRFKVSPATEDSVRLIAERARQRVLEEVSFTDVADEFSAQGHNVVGGRIGFVKRNELVEEFGRTAFNLQPGGISGLVLTEYGFHIIKSHGRLGDSVDVSQVLFPLVPSPTDSTRARQVADSLYAEIQKGADFRELAKSYSDDDETRGLGGELEPMTDNQLRPEFATALEAIAPGQVAAPVLSQRGYHIIKLLEKEAGRPLDPAKDFDVLRNFARQEKTADMVEAWVAELRKKVYIEIREMTP